MWRRKRWIFNCSLNGTPQKILELFSTQVCKSHFRISNEGVWATVLMKTETFNPSLLKLCEFISRKWFTSRTRKLLFLYVSVCTVGKIIRYSDRWCQKGWNMSKIWIRNVKEKAAHYWKFLNYSCRKFASLIRGSLTEEFGLDED